MNKISKQIVGCFKQGGKLLICGCGGLAAESSHFAGELVGKYKLDRPPLPAISLCNDCAIITAIANDYGFDHVFERQVQALGNKEDLLIALSTSGKSKSILRAITQAKKMGMAVLDWPRKGENTAQTQEIMLKEIHQVCKEVEKFLFQK